MYDFAVKNHDLTRDDLSGFLYYDLYLEVFPPLDNQDIIWKLRNTPPDKFCVQIRQYTSKTIEQYGRVYIDDES